MESPNQPTGGESVWVNPDEDPEEVEVYNRSQVDALHQSIVNSITSLSEAGYLFSGVATSKTDPGTPDAKVFYIANGKGTYEKFGGLEVTEDDVVVFYWDSAWHKVAAGIASQEKLSELEEKHDSLILNTFDEGFWICDETGKAIARLDILDSADFGNTLKKRIKDLTIDNNLTDTLADGFYIANNDGDVIAKYDGNAWTMSGIPSANLTVRNGTISKKIDMTASDRLILTRNSVTNDNTIAFVGKISETFGELTIGHGYGKGNAWGEDSQWTASWIVIDSADIKVYEERNQANDRDRLVATIPHGLTISGDIKVSIVKQTKDASAINKAVLTVSSQGVESVNEILWWSCAGDIYAHTTSALTECRLSWSCSKLAGGTWIFGDSFISPIGQTKWPYYLIQNEFLNWALNAHGGERAKEAFMELENLLEIAFPKTIIWAEAMNNPDTANGEVNEEWMLYYKKVKEVCLKYNIELILATAPTSNAEEATEGHDGRKSMHEAQNAFIRSCGDRYIDLAAAVGADGSGNWNPTDLKNSFDVHPTAKGAKVLYMQAIADAPELTL